MNTITFPCIIRYIKNESPEILYCATENDYIKALDSVIAVGNNVEEYAVFTVAMSKAKVYLWEDNL